MIDNSELKRLARRVIDIEALDGGEPIGEAWGELEAAATPAAVLALIAESERLHKLISWQGDANNEVTISAGQLMKHMHERDQLKAENERLRADYAGLARFNPEWDRVAAAQDSVREHMAMVVQLKAEVAGLRTGYEAYERVNAELKAEVEALREEVALGDKIIADRDRLLNMFDCPAHGQCIPYAMEQIEALRKDAEQWRALVGRAKSPVIGYTGCVICGAYTDHGGLPCPKTRAAANALAMENQRITPVEPLRVPHPLDAAMGKGEKS